MTTAISTATKAEETKPKKPQTEGIDWLSWAFLLPTIVLFLVFEFYPFFRALYLSFASTDLFGRPKGFAGLDNYLEMISDPTFLSTLSRTLIFTIITVLLKLLFGLSIALPLSYRLRGTFWMRSLVLVPMAVSTAIGTLVFRNMFAPTVGLFDQIFSSLGLPQVGWLTSPNVALFSAIIVDLWIGISFVILLLVVAIDNISTEVVEAANLDGATGFRYIRHIIVPGIAPMLMVLVVTQSIAAMKEFTIFNVLTGGGPGNSTRTLVLDIYDKAFGGGTADFAGASARGMVLFILVLVLTLVQFRLSNRNK
ncbi:carbohydrate ABC transporter permease [Corynebacterium liangguodongii]|uniref:Sugar ABC transporter permease n=1 Tax=Corynebacterium liangguodongii TaxID=2079535 RepID=A0A2S0WCI1_9CORY|nr:sugar ABC transporter permease [Corynebacterium liangguodongii]AWB83475.1 sugar ABC transporter permease [Corynebacterium liangguodongii]PWC00436.1 sugar ABC transporter permease [Corynebacterium liangguodongii]